jgi:prepilin-type processing-associated H-X9-DG protein
MNFDAGLSDQNVSYFFSVDASDGAAKVILAGDRNLQVAGQPLQPGLASITTNAALDWTRELHYKLSKVRCGNILFADGHVETRVTNLASLVQQQGLATNRLAVP